MLKYLAMLAKRPSDKSIRIGQMAFWSIYVIAMAYNLCYLDKEINTILFGQDLSAHAETIKYIISGLWIIPLGMWIYGKPIARARNTRIMQVMFSIILFFISSAILIEWPSLDIDTLIFLMAFFPLFAGITWKCITKEGLRYWEKVTTVRI